VNTATHASKIAGEKRLHALVGGFHLYPLDDARLDWTADHLRPFGVQNLVGAHCTGIEAVFHLRDRLGLARKTAVVRSGRPSPWTGGSIRRTWRVRPFQGPAHPSRSGNPVEPAIRARRRTLVGGEILDARAVVSHAVHKYLSPRAFPVLR
jgi:hypothetical protein